MTHKQKFRKWGELVGRSLCLLLIVSLPLGGCRSMTKRIESTTQDIQQTTQKTIQKLSFSKDHLHKKVAVAPFSNESSLAGHNLEGHLQSQIVESLKDECPKVQFVMADEPGAPPFLKDLPRQPNGQVDGYTLAQWSREFGLNGVLYGALLDVRSDKAREGFMWFRETKAFMQVQILVQAFNPETGAKYFDENDVQEVELEDIDLDYPQPSFSFNVEEVKKLIAEVGQEMGEDICIALNEHPWVGYIVAITQDQYLLSAGEKAGLKEGDVLEVFDSTKSLVSAKGERFFLPGHKIGELKITELRANTSKAELMEGEERIKVGCTVTYKD
jgi:hypothetical protein